MFNGINLKLIIDSFLTTLQLIDRRDYRLCIYTLSILLLIE